MVYILQSSTGTDLPVKQLGFLSVIEFISSPELSEVVKIKRPTERDWLIFDATAEGVEGKRLIISPTCLIHNHLCKK